MHRVELRSLPSLVAALCVTCAPLPPQQEVGPVAAGNITIGLQSDPALLAAVRSISADRIRATDSALVSFGTRHTMSDTVSNTRGIGAARRYLFAKLAEYSTACGGCLRVEFDPAMLEIRGHPDRPMVNVVNVLAWLPGRDTSRVIVMGGHYDSCVCSRTDLGAMARFEATQDAPGADDDGSGTSAVVELARVFSERFPRGLEASIIFAAYSGEEQGLYGSTHLAQRLHAAGYKVVAAFTDDIVGNVVAEDGTVDSTSVRIFGASGHGPSREMARYAWARSDYIRVSDSPGVQARCISRGGAQPIRRSRRPGLRFTERWRTTSAISCRPTFEHVNFG